MIAAGNQGALELFNRYDSDLSDYLGDKKIEPKHISNGTWIDCELSKYSTLLILRGIDDQQTLNIERTFSKKTLQEKLEDKSLDDEKKHDLLNNLVVFQKVC